MGLIVQKTLVVNQAGALLVPGLAGLLIDACGWRWTFVGSFCRGCTTLADAEYVWAGVAFALFFVFLVLFAFAEKRHPDPVIPLQILRNPVSDMIALYVLSFCTQNGTAWLLPQVLDDSALAAEILCPILNRKATSRTVMCVSYAITIAFAVGVVFALEDRTAYIVVNALMTFAMCFLQLTIYPALMVMVPHRFVASVGGIPTMSRTVGSSVSNCVFSSVLSVVYQVVVKTDGEDTRRPGLFPLCHRAAHGWAFGCGFPARERARRARNVRLLREAGEGAEDFWK